MNEIRKSSLLSQYIVVLVFFSFTVAALVTFGYNFFLLARELVNESKTISFNKGSIYMLGVGLGSGFLTYSFILELVKKSISVQFNNSATRIGLVIVAFVFILPQFAHLTINQYAKSKGYKMCAEASYQWLHVKNIIYTTNPNNCNDLIEKKN